MKTCYVSIAFGRKRDAAGREVDFDRIYAEMIRPAVQAAGLLCVRGDEFLGSLIHKEMLRAVIAADVMVADVSDGNANVMYELGMRHALRPAVTIAISSTRLPFNISHGYALLYPVGADGGPDPAATADVQRRLTTVLLERVDDPASDSPVYEYFPGLRVEIPPDLRMPRMPRPAAPLAGPDATAAAPADEDLRRRLVTDLRSAVAAMQGRLNRGRPAEAVSMAEGLASELAQARPVRLLLAQALSQLDRSDAAVQVLSQLVAEQPEDAEALALLGSLFKQRHFSGGGEADLQAALDHYRRAFTVSHQDLYLGRNLAQLLDRQGSPAAKAELASCLPELEALARHALDQPPVDYWTVQSALIIALLAGDAAAVEARLEQMLTLQPQSWMVEASIAELQGLRERSSDPARRERVDASIERLASSTAATEDDAEADDAQP